MVRFPLLACAALTVATILPAAAAVASETRCLRGDDVVRRVAIEVQDPSRDVPCEVVYWKDTEEPGVRSVLWSAQTNASFCAEKAEELVARLESGGWSCAVAGDEPRSASREAPPPVPAAAPTPPAERAEPESAGDGPQTPSPQEGNGSAASPQVRAALAPPREAAGPDDTATDAPDATVLNAIIEQNLVRLNDGVDGKFEAEIAQYGDLDGDGLDDGLVFFTYESQRLGKARFVAAYLFDGETYALAATKPLAGSDDNVHSAEIESIEDGVISVRLNVLEPGDASCCPSGLRRHALVLRGGQLIEARSAAGVESRS